MLVFISGGNEIIEQALLAFVVGKLLAIKFAQAAISADPEIAGAIESKGIDLIVDQPFGGGITGKLLAIKSDDAVTAGPVRAKPDTATPVFNNRGDTINRANLFNGI